MNKQIIWSPLAENDFANILNYLDTNWDLKIVHKFIDKLDNCILHLQKNPNAFPMFNKELNIRKCVITKNNTIFYRYTATRIEIIRIYDTRQDPKKLQFL